MCTRPCVIVLFPFEDIQYICKYTVETLEKVAIAKYNNHLHNYVNSGTCPNTYANFSQLCKLLSQADVKIMQLNTLYN